MFALQCLSCEHDNPVGAKYCAECGSRLNLTLCKHCEAINERTAQRCHNCGTELPALSMADQSGGAQGAGGPDVRMANLPSPVPSPDKRSAAGRVRTSRTLLSALLLAAIAGSAYYLYRQPTVGRSVIDLVRSAPGKANPGGTPAPSVALTAGAGAADASSPDSATAALPVSRSQRLVTHTERVVAAPIAPIPDVKQTAVAPRATRDPSAAAKPSGGESRVNVRQDQPSSVICTEAVAALGLCSPGTK